MKKKIIFMVINMNIGGTEKALLSMIDEVNKEEWEVTILTLERLGDFLDEIPKWVTVKEVEEYKDLKTYIQNPPLAMVKELIKEVDYCKALGLAYHYVVSKVAKNIMCLYKYLLKDIKGLKEDYDVAVAYAGPMDFITYFVHEKISAKKKIQWIHFDVTKVGFSKGLVKKLYPKFHKICVVSEEGKNKLVNMFPNIKERTMVFHNIVSKNKILQLADSESSFQDDFNGIKILTVGRLSWEKGQDLIIQVLARLKSEGYKVRWYCIGDGAYRNQCIKLIKEYKLEKDFILLGTMKNPYPYMKDCDIYVQASRHEGYCITLAEAKCFDKPIVSTKFAGAKEQLKEYSKGYVSTVTEEGIYEGIKIILEDKEFKY